MTISSSTAKTGNLPGNDSTTTFSFSPMVIYSSTDVEVIHTVTATGVETTLVEGTGDSAYSVTVTTYPGTGSITYPEDEVTPIPSTETITIKKVLTLEQSTDLENQGGYFPETLEQALDKLVGMVIQQQEEIDRCIKIPITEPTITNTEINTDALRAASQHVQVSSDGTTFVSVGVSSGTDATASDVTPAAVSVSAGAGGSGTDFSREDHVHFLPTTVPRLATETVWTESQVWKQGGDLASGTSPLAPGAGNLFDVTGASAITAITSVGIGTIIVLQFDAALTLTHHTTNLILPGAVNIITQAGDIAMLYEYASADWRLISYMHGTATNGRMPSPDYESAETSLNDDAQITFAHGLSAVPSKVEVVLRANTATAQGWADNEEMIFPNLWSGAVADDSVSVTADATNVYITAGFAIQLIDHGSFNDESITQSEYQWVVRAWK